MDEIAKLKRGATRTRWLVAIKDKAFDSIRNLVIIETRPEHFLRVLENAKVSTNVYLRRIHNFALEMNWLPWPVIVEAHWPKIVFKDKRAITWEEHQSIIAREPNPERKAFYQVAWHLGSLTVGPRLPRSGERRLGGARDFVRAQKDWVHRLDALRR